MPMLVDGDTDDMIDSSPFLKFPAHPGLRIRAQGPRNCSGSRKESAWRTCYATVSMNQAQVVLPRRIKKCLTSQPSLHLLGDTSPVKRTTTAGTPPPHIRRQSRAAATKDSW